MTCCSQASPCRFRPIAALLLLVGSGPIDGAEQDRVPAEEAAVAVDYGQALEQLRKTVADELQRGLVPGVSIALVDDQTVVMAEGFGLADMARQIPATAETVYRVGSISKLFNALAAMQLVERGKLDLDAPIARQLPEFQIVVPFEDAPPITLRQLLCHRSGMVRESPVGGYLDDSQPTMAASVASLRSCVLVNPPDTKTRYSNIGPTIVGLAVSAAGRQPFEQYQHEHLLQPLGMSNSAWRADPAVRQQLAVGRMRVADGQGGFDRQPAPLFELGTIPAGNLYSSARDMAEFAKMLLAAGRVSSGRVIQAETLRQMFTPQLTGEETGFGLGFAVGRFAGHKSIRHSGAVYGFTSSLVVLPEPGVAAIVLVNEDIAMGPVTRLSDAALSLMLAAKTGQQPSPAAQPLEMSAEQLSAFAGQYESESYWADVSLDKEGRLAADISGQPMTLTPVGPLEFEADGQFVHRAAVTFRQDSTGRTVGFAALDQSFVAVEQNRDRYVPADWQKYLGSYGPRFIPLVVSLRHGHLYAMTENMVDYRLTPITRQVFRMPTGLYSDEYLIFQLDPTGDVHAVELANMHLKAHR
jgi:CubicO group peptidase (beta-lactamase class C family)